jgi:hypothetical protein
MSRQNLSHIYGCNFRHYQLGLIKLRNVLNEADPVN